MEAQHLRNGLFLMMVLQINFGILLKKVKKFLQNMVKLAQLDYLYKLLMMMRIKLMLLLINLFNLKLKKDIEK
jgi:hypothetical protein